MSLLRRIFPSRRRRGDMARSRRDWPGAEYHYRRHLHRHPGDLAIWVQLGSRPEGAGSVRAGGRGLWPRTRAHYRRRLRSGDPLRFRSRQGREQSRSAGHPDRRLCDQGRRGLARGNHPSRRARRRLLGSEGRGRDILFGPRPAGISQGIPHHVGNPARPGRDRAPRHTRSRRRFAFHHEQPDRLARYAGGGRVLAVGQCRSARDHRICLGRQGRSRPTPPADLRRRGAGAARAAGPGQHRHPARRLLGARQFGPGIRAVLARWSDDRRLHLRHHPDQPSAILRSRPGSRFHDVFQRDLRDRGLLPDDLGLHQVRRPRLPRLQRLAGHPGGDGPARALADGCRGCQAGATFEARRQARWPAVRRLCLDR